MHPRHSKDNQGNGAYKTDGGGRSGVCKTIGKEINKFFVHSVFLTKKKQITLFLFITL